MHTVKASLLAASYLYPVTETRQVTDHKSFYNPPRIAKSSVGEFYAKNIQEFFEISKRVTDYLLDNHKDETAAMDLGFRLLPLAATTEVSVHIGWCSSILDRLHLYGLPEVMDVVYGVVPPKAVTEIPLTAVNQMERIAHRVCAAYDPRRDMPLTFSLHNEHYQITEHEAALLLYPWAMQPLIQLRALIPAMDEELVKNIFRAHLVRGVPFEYAYTPYVFDCLSDFFSYYGLAKAATTSTLIVPQARTPFFGIANYQDFTTHIQDVELVDQINKVYLNSKRLYMEMLKTGLKYEAQYATLAGMVGRYVVAGTRHCFMQLRKNIPESSLVASMWKRPDYFGTYAEDLYQIASA